MKRGHCAGCFRVTWLTRHHLKAKRNGGSEQARNIVKICRECHDKEEEAIRRGKGFKRPATWRKLQNRALELDAQTSLATQLHTQGAQSSATERTARANKKEG